MSRVPEIVRALVAKKSDRLRSGNRGRGSRIDGRVMVELVVITHVGLIIGDNRIGLP